MLCPNALKVTKLSTALPTSTRGNTPSEFSMADTIDVVTSSTFGRQLGDLGFTVGGLFSCPPSQASISHSGISRAADLAFRSTNSWEERYAIKCQCTLGSVGTVLETWRLRGKLE